MRNIKDLSFSEEFFKTHHAVDSSREEKIMTIQEIEEQSKSLFSGQRKRRKKMTNGTSSKKSFVTTKARKERSALATMFNDDVKSSQKELRTRRIPATRLKSQVKSLPEGEFEAIVVGVDYLENQESRYGRTDIFDLEFGIYHKDEKYTINERIFKGGRTSKYYRWFKTLLGFDPFEGFSLDEIIGKEVLVTVENNITERRTYQNILDIEAIIEDTEGDDE